MKLLLAARLVPTLLCAISAGAHAAPVTYRIDADHTYPSFEGDHMGVSVWRGKLTKTQGTVTLDKVAGTGSVDITMDAASIDFGQRQLNNWAKGPEFLDSASFAVATYRGTLGDFVNGAPTQVLGSLSLHGITRPVALKILAFTCRPHPMFRREVCGADATGSLQRDEFGLDMGKTLGFKMDVLLRIQVEALAE